MANDEHLALLKQGFDTWNAWRKKNHVIKPDIGGADLSDADLHRAFLSEANLNDAHLARANLDAAPLRVADLISADLSGASLIGANLIGANLHDANLNTANLVRANLSGAADLNGTALGGASLGETVFANVDLTKAKGLDRCVHLGPSTVDHRTLERSSNVPLNFWRGCGLPDWQIATIKLYQPNLSPGDINDVTDEIFRLRAEQPIQLYSCFISYSSKDRSFARRLHDDLQDAGVRLWFDEHDLKTGDRLRDVIDRAVRARDKLLLIFSEASIASQWVENEVETALEEERSSPDRKTSLFPIRIDDAVMETELPWARMIKRDRRITDMTGWNDEAAYQEGLECLLRDLRADPEGSSPAA